MVFDVLENFDTCLIKLNDLVETDYENGFWKASNNAQGKFKIQYQIKSIIIIIKYLIFETCTFFVSSKFSIDPKADPKEFQIFNYAT